MTTPIKWIPKPGDIVIPAEQAGADWEQAMILKVRPFIVPVYDCLIETIENEIPISFCVYSDELIKLEDD